jgi:cytochrome c oxidase subunit III
MKIHNRRQKDPGIWPAVEQWLHKWGYSEPWAASFRWQPAPVIMAVASGAELAPKPTTALAGREQAQLVPSGDIPPGDPPIPGEGLPTLVDGPRSLGWWGIMSLILIEVVVISSFIMTYYYLRAGVPRWPPDGISPPELLLPTLNSLLLFASTIPMYLATRTIRKGNQRWTILWLGLALLMGVLFLGLKWWEYSDQAYMWNTNAYASIVWTMTGFHAMHVIAVVAKTAVIMFVASRGYFNEKRHVAVEANSLYWFFVVGIWIPLYLTIYWAPRLL